MPCAQAMAALRAPLPQAVMEPTGDQERTILMTSSTSGGSAKGEQAQHWLFVAAFKHRHSEVPVSHG